MRSRGGACARFPGFTPNPVDSEKASSSNVLPAPQRGNPSVEGRCTGRDIAVPRLAALSISCLQKVVEGGPQHDDRPKLPDFVPGRRDGRPQDVGARVRVRGRRPATARVGGGPPPWRRARRRRARPGTNSSSERKSASIAARPITTGAGALRCTPPGSGSAVFSRSIGHRSASSLARTHHRYAPSFGASEAHAAWAWIWQPFALGLLRTCARGGWQEQRRIRRSASYNSQTLGCGRPIHEREASQMRQVPPSRTFLGEERDLKGIALGSE